MVECLPSKQGVAGSNPVSRSIASHSETGVGSRLLLQDLQARSFGSGHDRSGLCVGFTQVC